jgi:hypothetical protein
MRVKPSFQPEGIVHENAGCGSSCGADACGSRAGPHRGADLDEMRDSEEKFFQAIDEPAAPRFELADARGNVVRLSDFFDKIVVLNFIFASCTDFCPLHSELIAEVQKKINDTPMKDRVQFLTVTTDPAKDTREVLEGNGPLHGFALIRLDRSQNGRIRVVGDSDVRLILGMVPRRAVALHVLVPP